MVSLEGSVLDLASNVTVKGADQLVGLATALALIVKFVFILVKICDNGL
jgi:hypothetical protein